MVRDPQVVLLEAAMEAEAWEEGVQEVLAEEPMMIAEVMMTATGLLEEEMV